MLTVKKALYPFKNAMFLFVIVLAFILQHNAVAANSQTILVVGDSLSAAHNMPIELGWVNLLQQKVKQTQRTPTKVINASISGETSAGGLSRLPALLTQHQPNIVIIELGGNDGLRGLPPIELKKNLQKMVELSQKNGAKILLLGIDIPPNYGEAYRARLRSVYSDLAQQYNVELLPFLLEGIALKPELMQPDGIHPVANAQSKLLDNVWPKLRPLLHD